jgi:exopolysaccharide biosynthesis polyprenyl glycosylphosphotransferase
LLELRTVLESFDRTLEPQGSATPSEAVAIRLRRAVPAAAAATAARKGRAGPPGRTAAVRRLLVTTDLIALNAAIVVLQMTRAFGVEALTLERHVPLLALGLPLWLLLGISQDIYGVASWRAEHGAGDAGRLARATILWTFALVVSLWLAGITRRIEVAELVGFWAVAVALLMGLRSCGFAWARRRPWFWQRALVIGPPADAAPLIRRIRRNRKAGIEVVACVRAGLPGRFPRSDGAVEGVPLMPASTSATEMAGSLGVDRVFVLGRLDAAFEQEVMPELAELGVHVDLAPQWLERAGCRPDVHLIGGVPIITAPAVEPSRCALAAKRGMDVALSSVALVVLAPVLAVCALAIRLDSPGPILFRQRRVGRDDRCFEVLKFRSMRTDAEQLKADVAGLNFHGGGNDLGMFKIRRDPRVTRVGGVLRRYSLDELPQLVNVVRGDMSLVGPRPLIESEDRQVQGRYRRRTSLPPGLTGPWQVNGRSDVPFDEMIALDLQYVRTWSLGNDLRLMVKTVPVVLRGRGAY